MCSSLLFFNLRRPNVSLGPDAVKIANVINRDTVTLLFVFDKFYLIMD
jgi:hypothetical protein